MATDLEQSHFRFRTDGDAADATPTWGGDEDANYNPGASPFRLRMGLANVADASSGSLALYLQKNSGSYAAITTSSTGGVQSYDASSDADDTPIRIPRLSMSADWQLAGAAIDLDFVNNRIYPSGAFTDYLSCSRASDGYTKNSSGDWVQFSSNTLRITNLDGLEIEGARTNYLLNSETPATQTTESLSTGSYTLWVEGSGSALASGATATISGEASATAGSPNTFSVTGAGTVLVTVTGTLDRFQLENGAFASSYILTTAGSAVRAADKIICTGNLESLLEALPWTIVVDLKTEIVPDSYWQLIAESEGVTGGRYLGLVPNQNDRVVIYDGIGSVNLTAIIGNSRLLTTGAKAGVSQNIAAGASLVGGGGTVVTTANSFLIDPAGLPVQIGGTGYGNLYGFSSIRRVTFWNTKISDSTLQALTAP